MYVLPFSLRYSIVDKFNQWYVKKRLNAGQYDVMVFTNPRQYKFVSQKQLDGRILVYECMDNIPFFYSGQLRERMLRDEYEILRIVDGVIVSSDYLKMKILKQLKDRGYSKPVQTIYNALDRSSFINQNIHPVDLKRPNLVYIGTIGGWIDWNVIERFSSDHPEYTIYMIGPIEHHRELPSNVVFIGSIPHQQVPGYIASGDTMILPFLRNDLTEAVDPVKLYEYIALSKPVICSYWPELERFREHVYFYRSYEDFKRIALHIEGKDGFEVHTRFVEKHNWNIRVKEYESFLTELAKLKIEKKNK